MVMVLASHVVLRDFSRFDSFDPKSVLFLFFLVLNHIYTNEDALQQKNGCNKSVSRASVETSLVAE